MPGMNPCITVLFRWLTVEPPTFSILHPDVGAGSGATYLFTLMSDTARVQWWMYKIGLQRAECCWTRWDPGVLKCALSWIISVMSGSANEALLRPSPLSNIILAPFISPRVNYSSVRSLLKMSLIFLAPTQWPAAVVLLLCHLPSIKPRGQQCRFLGFWGWFFFNDAQICILGCFDYQSCLALLLLATHASW